MVSMMTGGSGHGKDRAAVEAAAKVLYEWLDCADSPLRDLGFLGRFDILRVVLPFRDLRRCCSLSRGERFFRGWYVRG